METGCGGKEDGNRETTVTWKQRQKRDGEHERESDRENQISVGVSSVCL